MAFACDTMRWMGPLLIAAAMLLALAVPCVAMACTPGPMTGHDMGSSPAGPTSQTCERQGVSVQHVDDPGTRVVAFVALPAAAPVLVHAPGVTMDVATAASSIPPGIPPGAVTLLI
jgi:hypothetical protein